MPLCPLIFALLILLETHWMLEKEPEHLSRGIRPLRIGVGAGATTTCPGMSFGPICRIELSCSLHAAQSVTRDLQFGQRRSEFIDGAAGHHRAGEAPDTRSDLDLARVIGVLDAAVGEATA